jgi:hypothetical protein
LLSGHAAVWAIAPEIEKAPINVVPAVKMIVANVDRTSTPPILADSKVTVTSKRTIKDLPDENDYKLRRFHIAVCNYTLVDRQTLLQLLLLHQQLLQPQSIRYYTPDELRIAEQLASDRKQSRQKQEG